MKDRNGDMRYGCTVCSCKEYVTEESVKCAFCGHFPIAHVTSAESRITVQTPPSFPPSIPPSVTSPTRVASPIQTLEPIAGCSTDPEVPEPEAVESVESEAVESVESKAVESVESEPTGVESVVYGEIDEWAKRAKSKTRCKSTFSKRVEAFLTNLHANEDGLEYQLKEGDDGNCSVVCQVCNVSLSLKEQHRGFFNLEEHVKTPRHKLNLTLLSDLYTLDEKVKTLMDAYPNTFSLPVGKNEKKVLRCRKCTQDFKMEAKLVFSNVMQHLQSDKHKKSSLKRPNIPTKSIGSFFTKKPTHEPVDL